MADQQHLMQKLGLLKCWLIIRQHKVLNSDQYSNISVYLVNYTARYI